MQDLRLLGELQFGVYERHSSPEAGDAPDTGVDAIMSEQQANVNHEAVHVPLRRNPFRNSEEEDVFFSDLREIVTQDITPANFGLTPEEWDSGVYPMSETIRIGRPTKDVEISLADSVWHSRTRLWCQSLLTLLSYLY